MNKTRKYTILLTLMIVIGVLVGGFNLVKNRGYIQINMPRQDSYRVTVTNLSDGTERTVRTNSGSVRLFSSVASYRIDVHKENGDENYTTIKRAYGFFKTTTVNANLQPETARLFVGDDPETCMVYALELFSYDCNQEYSTLKRHVPATVDSPAYAVNGANDSAMVQGSVQLGSKTYVLIRYEPGEAEGYTYVLHPLRSDLTLQDGITLKGLDNQITYNLQEYGQGFMLTSEDLKDVRYFGSPENNPRRITLQTSDTINLPISLSGFRDQIMSLYNDASAEGDDHSAESETIGVLRGKSFLSVHSSDAVESYTVKGRYTDGLLCGENIACLLSNGQLDVYTLRSGDARLLYSMKNISAVKTLNEKLVLYTKSSISLFDMQSLEGRTIYSFGSYRLCGTQSQRAILLVCIANKQNKQHTLLIDPSKPNTDSIDKKMQVLKALPQIRDVSISNTIIYISQNIGSSTYNPEIRGYEYSPETIQKTNRIIEKSLTNIGIDRSKYQVFFIYK
jgi:hypothetical protein